MATPARANILYEKPFSTLMLVMLSVCVGASSILLVLATTALATIAANDRAVYYSQVSRGAPWLVNVLFWLTVPVTVCIVSSVDLRKLVKHTLQPRRLVISAAICLTLWLMTFLLWTPCTFFASRNYSSSYNYCPYEAADILTAQSLVPFFAFIPFVCYALYLILGIVTWRHAVDGKPESQEAGLHLELNMRSRYKLASGVYTDIDDDASDSLPSTFHGAGITSPAPTAHPPSYVTRDPTGPPSRRASSFFSEMSHWRRDVEMMSISGTSHLCTCACHHGVVPQEQISEEQHTAVVD